MDICRKMFDWTVLESGGSSRNLSVEKDAGMKRRIMVVNRRGNVRDLGSWPADVSS